MLDIIHYFFVVCRLNPIYGTEVRSFAVFLKPVFVIVYVLEFVTSSTRTYIGDQCLCYVIFSIRVLSCFTSLRVVSNNLSNDDYGFWKFSDFFHRCLTAMNTVEYLNFLNGPEENQKNDQEDTKLLGIAIW